MRKKIFGIALLGFLSTLSAGVISQNGVAKDSVTGLIWQDNEPYTQAEKTAYRNNTNNGKAGNWNYAKAYCENLTLSGFSDWRLPNIYELTTLLDNTKSSEPYVINGIENIASDLYWSSTTSASYSSLAWNVYFDYGNDDTNNKTYSYYIRCVRAGQLNFDNLVILKNKGKLKVSQKNIDNISPKEEARRKKEAEISKKQEAQTKSVTTRSYNSWKTGYKFEKTNESYAPFNYVSTEINCSDGTRGTVFNYYARDTSYHYVVNGYTFKNFEEAANNICGN